MRPADVVMDERTEAKFGQEGLQEVCEQLWPARCQTCGHSLAGGKPGGNKLDGGKPALCVDDTTALTYASLHHPQCRPPGWNDESAARTTRGEFVTWRAQAALLPLARGDQPEPRPMLLVNPSLELVFVAQDQQRSWRVRPHARFAELGLVPVGQVSLQQPIRQAVARATGDSLTIAVEGAWPETYEAGVDSQAHRIVERAQELDGAFLGITHVMDPSDLDEHNLVRLIQSQRLLAGWAVLQKAT